MLFSSNLKDSELAGYKLINAALSDLFPSLPERSRFNRNEGILLKNLRSIYYKRTMSVYYRHGVRTKKQYPSDFRKRHRKMKRRVETTIGQLTQQFQVSRIRARTHWVFGHA